VLHQFLYGSAELFTFFCIITDPDIFGVNNNILNSMEKQGIAAELENYRTLHW
jgi:hypothetical protein